MSGFQEKRKILSDKVWYTYIARVQAHKRLEKFDFVSQLVLVWYSFLSVATGAYTLINDKFLGDRTGYLLLCLSVGVLIVSLVVSARDFRGRSINMKLHYVKLQRLYFTVQRCDFDNDLQKLEDEYCKLLCEVENHTTLDDTRARVQRRNQKLTRQASCSEYFSVYSMGFIYRVAALLITILPFIVARYVG